MTIAEVAALVAGLVLGVGAVIALVLAALAFWSLLRGQ